MQIVWKHGKTSAAENQQALAAHRPLKDSTIRTVLLRPEDKGYSSTKSTAALNFTPAWNHPAALLGVRLNKS